MYVYFLFNKKTQAFIGFTLDPKTLTGEVLWRRIEINKDENLANLTWEGNFSTGKFIRTTDKEAIVSEIDLEEKFYNRFFRLYNIEKLITIVLLQISKNIDPQDEDKLDPEFNKMLKFFIKNHNKFLEEIEYFQNSPKHKYQSKEDMRSTLNQQFKV